MKCCECALWLPTDEDVGECLRNYVETYCCHECKNGISKERKT